jgi:hypothetical protein
VTAPAIIRGTAQIAALLEQSEDSVERYAARNIDPLPIWYDQAERVCIWASALKDWVDRQVNFHRQHHLLRERGLLPGQKRAAKGRAGSVAAGGRKPRQRATKAAVRARGGG